MVLLWGLERACEWEVLRGIPSVPAHASVALLRRYLAWMGLVAGDRLYSYVSYLSSSMGASPGFCAYLVSGWLELPV